MTKPSPPTLPDTDVVALPPDLTPDPPPRASARAGDLIGGRFRLESPIGRGAMGEVWRAMHEGLDAPVAVKLVSSELRARASILERFFREAKTLAKITHPNVVRVLDVALPEAPLPYLVMELLDGEDLRSYIDRRGRLDAAESVHIVQGLVAGLAAAHAAEVVHRDLKPANIFLTRDASQERGYRVVVLDFGTALLLDAVDQRLTQAGIVVGTPMYMSPEQAAGELPSAQSDLYAAAAILYELLSTHVPHEVEDFRAMLRRRSTHEAAPISSLCPELPPAFDAFFRRALALKRDGRPNDAEAFRRALNSVHDPSARQEKPALAPGFDGEGFSNALEAALADRPPARPPTPIQARLDVVQPASSAVSSDAGAGGSIRSMILSSAEDLGEAQFDTDTDVPGVELDYEAAGLEAPRDPDAAPVPLKRLGPLWSFGALLLASTSAWVFWILRGGEPSFANVQDGPLLETMFVWLAVFIVGVALISRHNERASKSPHQS